MSITSIARNFFVTRQKELERYANDGVAIQAEVLKYLLANAKDTEYGRRHIFGNISSYDAFTANVPLNTYDGLKDYIEEHTTDEKEFIDFAV